MHTCIHICTCIYVRVCIYIYTDVARRRRPPPPWPMHGFLAVLALSAGSCEAKALAKDEEEVKEPKKRLSDSRILAGFPMGP